MPYKSKTFAGGIFLIALAFSLSIFSRKNSEFIETSRNSETINDSLNLRLMLDNLDSETPLDLSYHPDVEKYINLYLCERRSGLSVISTRADYYFPIIESYLDKYSLPLELKYLAIVESGLNPIARSKSGAVGLWQFLYSTCSLLDIKVTSYIDERRDVCISTDAACRYLKYLHETFNDWNLAIAAYNGGPGEVRKAIQRSGGKVNYWEIRPYLSKQAANYVPTFIAYNYIIAYREELGINQYSNQITFPKTDTVLLSSSASLSEIAKKIGISNKELILLNPIFKTDYIPADKNKTAIVLPKSKIKSFIKNIEGIYNSQPEKLSYTQLAKNAGCTKNKTCINYTVKQGDFFHKLAIQNNCTVENIKAWNNLTSSSIYPGQELKIWIKDQ